MKYRQILNHILHLLTCLLLLTAVAVNKNGKVCGYSIGNRDMVALAGSGAEADVADVAENMGRSHKELFFQSTQKSSHNSHKSFSRCGVRCYAT